MNWQDIRVNDWVLTDDDICFKVVEKPEDDDEDGNPYIYGRIYECLSSKIKYKVQIKELP